MKHIAITIVFVFMVITGMPMSEMAANTETDSITIQKNERFSHMSTFTQDGFTVSEPIRITANEVFPSMEIEGNGTETNPYILENLYIDLNTTESSNKAIDIRNVDCYFIIRNCYILGKVHWTQYQTLDIKGIGIYLKNVEHAYIFNNTFGPIYKPIYTLWTTDSIIHNNTIFGNPVGEYNRFDCFGISIDEGSDFNNISYNVISKTAAGIRTSMAENNIIEFNNVTQSDVGISVHIFSRHNTYMYNNLVENRRGIGFKHSNHNLITNNTCIGNLRSGIAIDEDSSNNNITFNLIQEMPQQTNPAFHVASDESFGVKTEGDSAGNSIIYNDIIGFNSCAVNNVGGNSYDYNYYSDYTGSDLNGDNIGDTPHDIGGDSPTQDLHPRLTTLFLGLILPEMPFELPVILGIGTIVLIIIVGVVLFRRR
jgi:hypothetical protein